MARRLLECGIHGLQRVSQRAVALDVFCEIPCSTVRYMYRMVPFASLHMTQSVSAPRWPIMQWKSWADIIRFSLDGMPALTAFILLSS